MGASLQALRQSSCLRATAGDERDSTHPADALPVALWPDSLSKHLTEARRRAAPCEVLNLPRFDLDEPADVSFILEQDGETAAGRFLKGVTTRR